jgi:hypothetical protein
MQAPVFMASADFAKDTVAPSQGSSLYARPQPLAAANLGINGRNGARSRLCGARKMGIATMAVL